MSAAARPPFKPWQRLTALVVAPEGRKALGLSNVGRQILASALSRAGRMGEGVRTRPDEAMFWRTIGGLADDVGLSAGSVKRGCAELRERRWLRWERVNAYQPHPLVGFAEHPLSVYYVGVCRLAEALGAPIRHAPGAVVAGGNPANALTKSRNHADGITQIPSMRSFPAGPHPTNAGKSGGAAGPPTSLSVVNSVVSLNKQTTSPNPAHPPPVVVVEDSTIEDVFQDWHDRIGAPRGASEHDCQRVREAVTRALAAGVPAGALHVVIAARADVRVGTGAYVWCEGHGVWRASLFWSAHGDRPSGCIDRLLDHASQSEAARRAEAEREARQRTAARPAGPLVAAGEVAAFMADLQRGRLGGARR